MSVKYFKGAVMTTEDATGIVTISMVPSETPPPIPTQPPTPTPSPTPTPTPPVGGAQEVPLNQQNFMQVVAGVQYYAKLPFPFGDNMSIQFGSGQGTPPTFVESAISTTPGGGIPSPYPQGVSGDPAGGFSIAASLHPTVDRGGIPQQAQVVDGVQNYLCFKASSAGAIVYGPTG